ncbi:MAG: hypothetical protein JW956_00700, partial [Calditrichaceae bacterium]|nr:hypothetical protein [Calditrichaceae bacterium]
NNLFFNINDLANALGISKASAAVTASRYADAGLIIRLKQNLYVTKEKWENLNTSQFFKLANILQVPSYISLMTALSFYQITTQIQQGFVESIAIKRTKTISLENITFTYSKIKLELYSGFVRDQDIFIARPEKAFLDAFYLKLIGRYQFDIHSIDFGKFDAKIMNEMAKSYPVKIQKMVDKNDYIGTA